MTIPAKDTAKKGITKQDPKQATISPPASAGSENTKGLELAPDHWVSTTTITTTRPSTKELQSSNKRADKELQQLKKQKKTADAAAIADEGRTRELEEEIHVRGIEETPDVPFATAAFASSDAAPTVVFDTAPAVASTTTTATIGAATTPSSAAHKEARVPPNAPPGGQWVKRQYIGPATWSAVTIISVCSCIFCLLPCGLWGLLCPCDQRLVYAYQGTAYDEHGRVVGKA